MVNGIIPNRVAFAKCFKFCWIARPSVWSPMPNRSWIWVNRIDIHSLFHWRAYLSSQLVSIAIFVLENAIGWIYIGHHHNVTWDVVLAFCSILVHPLTHVGIEYWNNNGVSICWELCACSWIDPNIVRTFRVTILVWQVKEWDWFSILILPTMGGRIPLWDWHWSVLWNACRRV